MPRDLLDEMDVASQPAQQPRDLLDEVASKQNISGILPRAGADILAGAAQFSQGIANTPYNVAKYMGASPQTLSRLPAPDTTNWSSYFGVNNPNLLDKFAQGAVSYAPALMAGGASSLGQIGAGAAYGATQNANPVTGAGYGALFSAIGEAAPAGMGLLKGAVGYVKPQNYASKLMDFISDGNSPQENAKLLASKIQQVAQNKREASSDLYDSVFRSSGDSSLYHGVDSNPLQNPNSEVSKLSPQVLDAIQGSDKSNGLFQDFLNNPTVRNAHNAQAQLGADIRRFTGKNLGMADYFNLDRLSQAQEAIQNDMHSYFNNANPEVGAQYQAATQHYLNEYLPYKENRQISSIVKGKNANPDNITNIFSSPESGTAKVVEDLGPQAKNQILFDALKKSANTPDQLLAAFDNLKNKGLDNYITPEVNQMFESLRSRVGMRNFAQRGAGALFGASLLSPHAGMLGIPEALGALGGAAGVPMAMKTLQSRYPIAKIGGVLGDFIKGGYNVAKPGILANLIRQNPEEGQ
jgi:hypothetical protein